jgi:hypothetical protein
MNLSDWDDPSVGEALTLPFVVLMNDCDVRTNEPDFGHLLAHRSRSGIPRIRVETAEKRLDRVGPHPAAAECVNPHRIRSVDSAFRVSIMRTHGFGPAPNHLKNGDAIRGMTLTGKVAGEGQDQCKDRSGSMHSLSRRSGLQRLKVGA